MADCCTLCWAQPGLGLAGAPCAMQESGAQRCGGSCPTAPPWRAGGIPEMLAKLRRGDESSTPRWERFAMRLVVGHLLAYNVPGLDKVCPCLFSSCPKPYPCPYPRVYDCRGGVCAGKLACPLGLLCTPMGSDLESAHCCPLSEEHKRRCSCSRCRPSCHCVPWSAALAMPNSAVC